MSLDTVMSIAQQLAAEGRQPSVALIKSRLPAPCPMPDVILGLQRWRSQQASVPAQTPTTAPRADDTPTPSLPDEWQAAVRPLQTELAALRQEVAQLRDEVVMLRRLLRQASSAHG